MGECALPDVSDSKACAAEAMRRFDGMKGGDDMSAILIVLLILLLIGAVPSWPHSRNWGYYPSGLLGVALLVVIILALVGRL